MLKEGKVVGILTDEQEGVGLASLVSVVRIVLRGWGVDPSIERTTAANRAEKPGAVANAPTTSPINLLSPRNGGRLLVAPNEYWKKIAEDSGGDTSVDLDQEGVWGFKDGQSALLESFSILIPKTKTHNVGEVELFYGNDDPYGKFESIGKFNTRNVLMVETPYQEFKFAPVRAKYFKVRVLSNHGSSSTYVYAFRLFGRPE